jgi:hypothetical protein
LSILCSKRCLRFFSWRRKLSFTRNPPGRGWEVG